MRLVEAASKNDWPAVDGILSLSQVIPQRELDEALQKASEEGFSDIVKRMLADKRANPAACSFQAREFAISPAVTDSYALQMACYKGHDKVVALLLDDGRSDASVDNFRCIRLAAQMNHAAVVRILDAYLSARQIPYKPKIGTALTEKIEGVIDHSVEVMPRYETTFAVC
ncbi:ankyrin repeat domain-containing protein [Legionella oakridgensis]|uniref:Ankyrin repeat protein n=2 Tax=Legionella oakridgensis TaxID=29423 RepID=W0B8S9_9GAMM|nr:ankyrin repeat domain-containing protein [Legionella oakridgensis]AHE66943.1 hypothetical protein Loa_01390 [Legionella oakridgensis ATCC 33761 = DSM 21215]ETO93398.1 hypothetical protein LOR_60c14190 [Legionella oakridgensis RV-2-2007]KTD39511.1 Ankyrin repeat protein [Legionella oakridgensis]STY20049.1 Ankyrin repeat protein [Legionella longbeachae]